MKNNNNILICKNIDFRSDFDKEAFFEWIEKMDCIDGVISVNTEYHLQIASRVLHDYSLRDLLGLLYRYKVDMQQLARFLTDDNKKWFYDNKVAFWREKVFGVKVEVNSEEE